MHLCNGSVFQACSATVMFDDQASGKKAKKRRRQKSGSGSESETGSLSDTDDEDTSAVKGKLFILTQHSQQ